MISRTAVVIGDGQMAADCAKQIADHEAYQLPVLIHHGSGHAWSSQIRKFSEEYGVANAVVDNINDRDAIDILDRAGPDIIFSVNNWDIIGSEVLEIPADGIVNFHNGPLPQYRGVNVPSWAIINREREHGVTWHLVTETLDGGDIVAEKSFALSPDETAISLTLRCIQEGTSLFGPLLNQYAAGRLQATPQKPGGRYYSFRDSPNDGYLDFEWDFERLSALVRGLSFRPFENQFTWPKVSVDGVKLMVSDVSLVGERAAGEHWTCGEVQAVEDSGIIVNAQNGRVRLSGLMDENLSDLSDTESIEATGVHVGLVLRPPG